MARKIEQRVIAAIREGMSLNRGNTTVEVNADATRVYLFGNLIAEIGHPVTGTRWTLAGWNTATTRSRINALARAFNWTGVYTKAGQAWSDRGDQITDNEWVNALA